MNRWSWTAWYKSNTMRALVVALVAFGLDKVGLPDALAQGAAQHLADLVLGATQGAALLAGLYARARQPTPPLTISQAEADKKNAAESYGVDEDE